MRFGQVIGIAGFRSLDRRRSTPTLGAQQAVGGVGRVGIVLNAGELSLEAAIPAREALDSELLSAASVRRFSRDYVFSLLVAKPLALRRGLALVPSAGGGFAALETSHYRYEVVGGAVQTTLTTNLRIAPIVTVGADLRATVSRRIQLVVNHRLHVLNGSGEALAGHRVWQHRAGVGIQYQLRERQ
jgi:hypothetical protein